MKAFDSWKALFTVLLLCALVWALNVIAGRLFAPIRIDTSEGNVYTLTDGTRSILKKAKDSGRPVRIRFYKSDEQDVQLPKELRDYSKRVEDLLEEYAKASDKAVVVQAYNPEPNSDAEDSAMLDGIMRRDPRMDMPQDGSLDDFDYNQRGRASQPYYFGLSISSLEKIEVIPFLDPKLEENLEYQLSRAISAVTRKSRRKIGLLEGSEMALGGEPGMMGPGRPPSVIYRHLARDFEIVSVPFDVGPMKPGDNDHPFADLDLLLIVHPVKVNRPQSPQPGMPAMGATTLEMLSDETQYAIDQYLVNGGKAIAFLDNQHFVSRFFDVYSTALPFQVQDNHPQWYKDLYNLFQSNGWAHYRSGLDKLTTAWGINLGERSDDDPLIYDPKYSRPVAYNRPLNQMVGREFRLTRILDQIQGRNLQLILGSMSRGHGLMAAFENEALTEDHPVTRNLSSVLMVDPSPIKGKPTGGLKMKTLIRTSPRAKAVPGRIANLMLNQSENLEQISANFQGVGIKTQRYPVAVLLEGKFKSAYDEDPTKPDPAENPPAPITPTPIPATPPIQAPLLPPDAPDSNPTPEVETPDPGTPEVDPLDPGTPEVETPDPGKPAPPPAPESTPESGSGQPVEGSFPNPQAEEADETEPANTTPSKPAPTAPAEAANPSPTETEAPAPEEPEAEPEEEDHHLKEGTTEGAIAIISDADMLFDFFMGDAERGAERANDNVAFIMNLVETMAGDEDLVNIRGRDSTNRTFDVIDDIRERAADRAREPREQIKNKIQEFMQESIEGQERKQIGEGLFILGQSEESIQKTQEIQRTIRDLEREKNKIDRDQRNEVEAAINRYEWWNMLLTPTLVIILGLVVGLIRKLKTAAK